MKRDASTTAHDMQESLAANLRFLCGFYPSVAHVCRVVGINRTQFNRYLAATARPSPHMLTKLCDFFGVEAVEIHLPPAEFARLIGLRKKERVLPPPFLEPIEQLQMASRAELKKYIGYYRQYYYSMSAPGKILIGLVHLFEREGQVYFHKIEHVCGPSGPDFTFKYRYTGAAFFLGDRLFLVDAESLTRNEITQMILFPTYKNKVGRLTGLILGVSSGDHRRIACSRFLMEWLGTQIDLRKALSACAIVDPGSGLVDPEIVALIDNRKPDDVPLFYAAAT